jgi:hypothetical protein
MRYRCLVGVAWLVSLSLFAWAQDNSGVDTSALEAQKLISQALERISDADCEGALGLLERALDLNPNSFPAHFWIAYIDRQKAATDPQKRQEAIRHLQRALEIIPEGDAAQSARSLLVRLTGRPAGVSLLLSAPEGSRYDPRAKATSLVAQTMCGQGNLSYGSEIARIVASSFGPGAGSRASDASQMCFLTKACPLAEMQKDGLTSLVHELAGTGAEGNLRCGWLVGLTPVNLAAVRTPDGKTSFRFPGYARLQMTVVDPVDAHVVGTFEINSGSLQYALPTLLLSKVAGTYAPLAELLGFGEQDEGETSAMVTCLAAQAQHRLTRLIIRLRERELRDEIALPVEGGLWVRSTAKTPREALAETRIAVAPIFCPDVTAEQTAADLEDDLAAAVSGAGSLAVIPAAQLKHEAEKPLKTEPKTPLLRRYEQVARGGGARYLLLTWFDEFQSKVETKNLVGSEALVRMAGHLAIRDLQRGTTVVTREFNCASTKSEFVGDVAEKYLIAVENAGQQVVKAMADAVSAIDGNTGEEG